jgi:oxygen-independent coproporphyrinogen III oxidase
MGVPETMRGGLDNAGLYVHVPFCQSKCRYCDFYSVASLDQIDGWLQGIKQESQQNRHRFERFDTVYVGGGTPTVLPTGVLQWLFEILRSNFRFGSDVEITVEANPDDVTPQLLAFLRKLGANRLSLGVQSFDDRSLRFLGRRHSARQAEQALEWARRAGFDNVGVDLIYGLPDQSEPDWLKQLEHALSFGPEHLSCYQLTLEAETPLGKMLQDGSLRALPEESARALFLLTSQFLEDHGYLHYEISNFARGERYRSRHNCKYWEHVPYLGLGPAAHSFCDRTRWWNVRSLDGYSRALALGHAPIEEIENLSAEQLRLERLFLGFRTRDGVDLKWLDTDAATETARHGLIEQGLVRIDHGRMKPTREGMVIADSLPLWFCK